MKDNLVLDKVEIGLSEFILLEKIDDAESGYYYVWARWNKESYKNILK